ncbi:TPA: BppU family phage baseplate upper protein [Enterococcus faecalis]|uniref:BppU family phage baseplate upper protein n=1 Tax=Enterococcus faecalis TaxID=1351 RepID=UPI00296C32F9|nr:BppU family phage baseplate upper protein [Enterococcus faecalis]HAP4920464.1 BppU family phage baseplate upper protein [Enterococcus faecalis]
MANKILNLDFSKDPIMPPIIYGRVGDEKMQTITVKISRRDEIADLSGGIITFEGEPEGGKVKVFDSENVSSNNAGLQKGTFEYTFPSAAFSVEGTYKRAYFSFQKDGKRDTTGDFKIIVKGNADIDAEEAETIITEYNKLVKSLNEEYQAALNKMNTDYDNVEKRIEAIKVDLNTLKKQITDILIDAEGRISAIGKTVTDEVDAALEKFKEGNFYTKQEADNRFLSKTENLEIQNKKLTNDDGSGLPLPKGVTSFKELSGYAGFYYLNATVAGTMTDKADLPTEFKYSALYVYQHAIAGTAGAMYQEIRMNSLTTPLIAFRTISPNSSQNSPFKILATTDSVVNLTDIENGALVSKKTVIKAQNWNEILDKGIYTVFGASGINRPYDGAVYGVLVVYADNTFINQTYIYKGETYTRSRQGSPATWTNWTKIASTEDILAENKVYRYLRTSLDLSNKVQAAKDAINATESKVDIFRIGNTVFFNMRINVKDYTKFGNDMPIIYDLPMGFRTLGDLISNTYFNNSLSVSQWAFAQSSAKNYMAIVEGSPQDIRFGSAHNGNTYVQGSWLTKDPFPNEGSLNGGSVSILNRLPDGSLA